MKTKVKLWLDTEEDLSATDIKDVIKKIDNEEITVVKSKIIPVRHSKFD